MVISLIVLLIPVAVIVALFRFYGGEDVVVTDPRPAFDAAVQASAFRVLEPEHLGEGWRPVSQTFGTRDGGSILRVGYLTPDGGAVQLIETNQPADAVISRELGDRVVPGGTVPAGGRTWQVFTVRDSERALLLLEPARTVVVIGRASQAELVVLAASLD